MRKISRKCCTFGEKILSKFDIKLRNFTSVIITVENSNLLSDAMITRNINRVANISPIKMSW